MFPESVVIAFIVCCIMFDGKGAAGADVDIRCPATFKDNAENTITCVINSTAIAKINCGVTPTQVDFNLQKQTEQSSSSACDATYPCTTTSDPLLSKCSCTANTDPAEMFTYTFRFVANKTLHEKGTFTCTVCAGIVINNQENCDSLNFDAGSPNGNSLSGGAIAGIVIGSLAGAGLVAGVVYLAIKNC